MTGQCVLKLWIEKTIRTQLNRYSIYKGRQYGANIEDLVIGKTYGIDFAESELRREIEIALLKNEDIHNMDSFSAVNRGSELNLSFTLATSYGAIAEVYKFDT